MTDRSSESYGQNGGTWVDRFGVWLSQRAIRKVLPKKIGLEMLELGCGYRAAQLSALADRAARATAVDFAIAPETKADPKFRCVEDSIEKALPQLERGSFDVVLLISVLEHLRTPDHVLAEVHGLLRPDGILLINVPTWRGKCFLEFSAFRLGLSPKVEMDDHKMYYDKRDLWPKLVAAGFAPSRIQMKYHKFGLNLFSVARK